MVLRKSHSKGTKFWGCTAWKDTGCDGSAPYHGDGARTGLDIDVREIKNGYVITTSHKYTDTLDDETSSEVFCKDKNELELTLSSMMQNEVSYLVKRIQETTDFVDEIDTVKHAKRVKVAKKGGTKDVGELLEKLKKTKAAAAAIESED
jgi:hypothetical protein